MHHKQEEVPRKYDILETDITASDDERGSSSEESVARSTSSKRSASNRGHPERGRDAGEDDITEGRTTEHGGKN
jgi:hypothetical protein